MYEDLTPDRIRRKRPDLTFPLERGNEINSLQKLKEWGPSIRAIFIDDGGVLNDNRLRTKEWLRLLGEIMPARLGGTSRQWIDANREVFPPLWSEIQKRIPTYSNYREFRYDYDLQWMKRMCAAVGVECPPDEMAIALSLEVAIDIGKRAVAEIKGATDAVRALQQSGYKLHMASGTSSWELEAILSRMNIRQLFGELIGPDILDRVKHGSEFYVSLFGHVDVNPGNCLVLESDPDCCRWAVAAGAKSIRVDCDQHTTPTLAEVAIALC